MGPSSLIFLIGGYAIYRVVLAAALRNIDPYTLNKRDRALNVYESEMEVMKVWTVGASVFFFFVFGDVYKAGIQTVIWSAIATAYLILALLEVRAALKEHLPRSLILTELASNLIYVSGVAGVAYCQLLESTMLPH